MTRSHRIQVGPLGPIIEVGLAVGTDQARMGTGGPPLTKIGLIDTGATRTAISNHVFELLQPSKTGTTSYKRPHLPSTTVLLRAVRFKFQGHLAANPWFDLEVLVVDPATPGIDVLIGMDVPSQLVLFYEGVNGHMILTY